MDAGTNLHAAADYAASHELTSEVRAISSAMHGFPCEAKAIGTKPVLFTTTP